MTKRGTSYEGVSLAGVGPAGVGPAQTATGQRRIALVIGNGAYSYADPLPNPANDAEAMAAVLTRLGFDVVKGIDLDLRAMGDLQVEYEAKLRGHPDVALLFYAGHGLQVKGRNYLVPVDAEITAPGHLSTRAIQFNDILEPMSEDARDRANIIFLDACRNNPFTRNLTRALGESHRLMGVRGGLAKIEKVAGTFISYATAPDETASDGKGANSPFTSALLHHIETPGLSIGDMMIDVRNAVLAETNNNQDPWEQSNLRSKFYFVPEEVAQPVAPAMSAAAEEWASVQNTTSLATLALFKERYPDPPWGDYADIRAGELRLADKQRREAEEAEAARAKAAEEERANTVQQAKPVATMAAANDQTAAPPLYKHKEPVKITSANIEPKKPLPIGLLAGGTVVALAAVLAIWQPWQAPPGASNSQGTVELQSRQHEASDQNTIRTTNDGIGSKNSEFSEYSKRLLRDSNNVWTSVFSGFSKTYQEPQSILFATSILSPCGNGQHSYGPFYCPLNKIIYMDTQFFQKLSQRVKASEEYSRTYIITHIIGHHIQNLLGISAKVAQLKQKMSKTRSKSLQNRYELQADCLAGLWAGRTQDTVIQPKPNHAKKGIAAVSKVIVNLTKKSGVENELHDLFDHGTLSQRIKWFDLGFSAKKMSACDTFNATNL